jgi:LysM repeat protein
LIFLAAGVFLFLILLIVYMTRESSSDLQPLQKRIAFLEQKMAQLEGQNKELSGLTGKMDTLRKDLTEKAQHLEKEMAKLRMEKESAPQKIAPTPPPEEKPAQKPARVHAVMRGETLYGISKKYGLSVEELRRLNNLKPNQQIMVGQKLNVGSP